MDGGLVVHYLSLGNVWPLKGSSYLSQGLKTAMAICAIISRLKSSPAGGRGGGRRRLTGGVVVGGGGCCTILRVLVVIPYQIKTGPVLAIPIQ